MTANEQVYGVFLITITRRRRALELPRSPFLRYRAPPCKSPKGRIISAVRFTNPIVCQGEDYILNTATFKHDDLYDAMSYAFHVAPQPWWYRAWVTFKRWFDKIQL